MERASQTIPLKKKNSPLFQIKTNKKESFQHSEKTTPFWMLTPVLAGLAVLVYFPLVTTIVLSFLRYFWNKPQQPIRWVGLKNYIDIFTDSLFWQSFNNTVIFMVVSTSLTILIGLGIALFISRDFPGKSIFISLILLPMMISPVAAALTWKFLFDGEWGAVNYFIGLLGIPKQAWLADPRLALPAIIVTDIWLNAPFVFLVMYTSLQALPQEPIEAARIDGGTGWQIFSQVIFPLLAPNFILILIIRLMDTFRVFDFIYVMTSGGPGGRTETIGFLSYERTFRHFNMGQGSVIAIFLLVVVLSLSWYFIKTLQLQLQEQAK
mgnify:FL=1